MNRAGMNIAVTDASVPVGVLAFVGALLGKRAAEALLGWTPPYSMEAGLVATVAAAK